MPKAKGDHSTIQRTKQKMKLGCVVGEVCDLFLARERHRQQLPSSEERRENEQASNGVQRGHQHSAEKGSDHEGCEESQQTCQRIHTHRTITDHRLGVGCVHDRHREQRDYTFWGGGKSDYSFITNN